MANGQFHGKRKFGVKITNPLPLTVSVRIKCPTGALHTGDGKETWRTIKPGETLYIPTKGRCEVDIDPSIVRYDAVGNTDKVGDAGFRPIQKPASGKKPVPQAGPVLVSGQKSVKSGRWLTVAEWTITKGFAGLLNAISIQLDGDCSAEVIIARNKPVIVRRDTTLTYQNNTWINKGESVRVKAHSIKGAPGSCSVMIQGELYPVGTPVPADKAPKKAPEHITEEKKRKEPEEPELRSLGDMIEDMRKREEVVKV